MSPSLAQECKSALHLLMCSVSQSDVGTSDRYPTKVGTYPHDCLQPLVSTSRLNGVSTGNLTDGYLGCSTGVPMGLGTGDGLGKTLKPG